MGEGATIIPAGDTERGTNPPRELLVFRQGEARRGFLLWGMGVNRVMFSSASDRWSTPRKLYDSLNEEFGFDFDPCPLDGEQDGLAPLFVEWKGKRVFCNPPYGPGIAEWLKSGLEADLAVFLIPARTDTRWFHEIALPKAKEIRFIRGRLKFGDAKNSAPFPSMLVIFERVRHDGK